MERIIIAVLVIVVTIGVSAWWKGRLIGQGKIIKRAADFMEYAEIFTVRPLTNEELKVALESMNLTGTGVVINGNTNKVQFARTYSPANWFTAELRCEEQTSEKSVYRFEFHSWQSSHNKARYENEMNMLLTIVEKMFVGLDPNTQVSTVKIEVETKRSIF